MQIRDEDCDIKPLQLDDFLDAQAQKLHGYESLDLLSARHSIELTRIAAIREYWPP